MSDKIKNCPYTTCGHEASCYRYPRNSDDHPEVHDLYQVECGHCQASGPGCDTEDAAIQEWNAIERHEPRQKEAKP